VYIPIDLSGKLVQVAAERQAEYGGKLKGKTGIKIL
jgi:hypothetical protein